MTENQSDVSVRHGGMDLDDPSQHEKYCNGLVGRFPIKIMNPQEYDLFSTFMSREAESRSFYSHLANGAALLVAAGLVACGGSGGGSGGTNTLGVPVNFSGVVTNSLISTEPVVGATASISSTGNTSSTTVNTDNNGRFRIDAQTGYVGIPTAGRPVYVGISAPNYESLLVPYPASGLSQSISLVPLGNRVVFNTPDSLAFTTVGDGDAVATNENTLLERAAKATSIAKTFTFRAPTQVELDRFPGGVLEIALNVAAVQDCQSSIAINSTPSQVLRTNKLLVNNLTDFELQKYQVAIAGAVSAGQPITVTVTSGNNGIPCQKTDQNKVVVRDAAGNIVYEHDDFIFYGLYAELKAAPL